MSKRKKRRSEESRMPSSTVGLLRFFEEETHGFKVKPELVVVLGVVLIAVCMLAQIFFTRSV